MFWKTLVHGRDVERKGIELERAIPSGFHSRFAIYSVRTYREEIGNNGRFLAPDAYYRVRDAATVTMKDTANGKRPDIFGEYETLEQALQAINPYKDEP